MNNTKFNPETLMELSYEYREAIIGKLSIYQLNLCYTFYNEHLLNLNHFINKKYNNFIYTKNKINSTEFLKLNNRIKKFEQIIALINSEMEIRNIPTRFFK